MDEDAWVGGESGSIRTDQEDRRAEPAVAEMLAITQAVQECWGVKERRVYVHIAEVEIDEAVH